MNCQARRDGLALEGGPPVRRDPLPIWPNYGQAELEVAQRILLSGKLNYWAGGSETDEFEAEFAAYHGTRHAIALANGTLALELALRVLGIRPGDDVIVTPRSYIASASCCDALGARPVFADIDEESQNVTAATVAAALTPKTKAIIAVHLAGWPCDMPAIMDLARQCKLLVIEDCAQAVGAKINGQLVGTFGDVAAFSFCQDKIISTVGEGGMLLTDDESLWQTAWSYKDHGKNWHRARTRNRPPGFRWVHDSFGSNYRITELQAAIGRLQLHALDNWLVQRRAYARKINDAISDMEALRSTLPGDCVEHAYYKYYAFLEPSKLRRGWDRDRILMALEAEGVPGLSGSCPEIYLEQAFQGGSHKRLPVARRLGETSLMFPVHPSLAPSDIEDMIEALRKVVLHASA
jgi:dTDP-4-amino-4,6-dideoxygalactose transaminase